MENKQDPTIPNTNEINKDLYKQIRDYVIKTGNSDFFDIDRGLKLNLSYSVMNDYLELLQKQGVLSAPDANNKRKVLVEPGDATPEDLPKQNQKSDVPSVAQAPAQVESPEIPSQSQERFLSMELIKNMYEFTVLTAMAKLLKEEMENEEGDESYQELEKRLTSLETEIQAIQKKTSEAQITEEDYKKPKNIDAMKIFALEDAIACNDRVISNTNKMAEITKRQDQLQTEGREYSPQYFTKDLARPDSLSYVNPMTPEIVEELTPQVNAPINEPTGNSLGNSKFVVLKSNLDSFPDEPIDGFNGESITETIEQKQEIPTKSVYIDPESYTKPWVRAQAQETLDTILLLQKRIPELEQKINRNFEEESELSASKFVLSGLESEAAHRFYSIIDTISTKDDLNHFITFLHKKDKSGGKDQNLVGNYLEPLFEHRSFKKYLEELRHDFGNVSRAPARFKAFSDALEEYSATLKK